MEKEAMRYFLSEDNINRHIGYLKDLGLKYSILVKSEPLLEGKKPWEIRSLKINRAVKCEAISYINEMTLHKVYFSSFSEISGKCEKIRKIFTSKEGLSHKIYEMTKDKHYGFIYIIINNSSMPEILFCNDFNEIIMTHEPVLALDLCEHSYFADYSFNRERYIKNALQYFNYNRLEDKIT